MEHETIRWLFLIAGIATEIAIICWIINTIKKSLKNYE